VGWRALIRGGGGRQVSLKIRQPQHQGKDSASFDPSNKPLPWRHIWSHVIQMSRLTWGEMVHFGKGLQYYILFEVSYYLFTFIFFLTLFNSFDKNSNIIFELGFSFPHD